jgi:WD40 repeat protein/serine/threonine protein kinase/tetratricopeptide (TPR) repeat protein
MPDAGATGPAVLETLALGPAPGTGPPRDDHSPPNEKTRIEPASALPQVPGYDLLSELGRGGMGVVYKAREQSLGRIVALKMVLAGAHAGSDEIKRFRAEAEVLARLQHPNLVQIYGFGEQEGKPYFALEFVNGGDLQSKIDGKPQHPEDAARLTETLARAMHVAHQHSIVHRDLKPANVLLAADGTPKITDFGLAKQLDSATGGTRTGAIMGTPSYMSPEQAAGRGRDIGPHTDVYALGAMLYEFLTGRPPFLADSGWDTVLQVVNDDPVPPRRLQPKVPRDLETICLKCLEKEPRKRYVSAAALADDLARFRNHEPIAARPTGILERLWKWARRRPAAAVLALCAILGTIALLVLGTSYHLHIEHLNEDNRRNVVRLSVTQGTQELRTGNGYGALVWYTYALHRDRGDAASEAPHRDRIAAHLRGCPRLTALWLHQDAVFHGSFSPDGKLVVTACADNSAYVYDRQTGDKLASLPHNEDVVQAWFSPDGKRVLTASRDKTARIWDAASGGALTPTMTHGAPLECAYFSPDGRMVVTAGGDPRVHVWDSATGREIGPPLEHRRAAQWAVFSPDGRYIATAGEDRTARVWDVKTHAAVGPPLSHNGNVLHVAFSPDSEYLVSSSDDHTARLWRVGTGIADERRLVAVLAHNDVVRWGAFSPDNQRVLTVSDDKTARVWSVKDGRLTLPPLVHGSNVRRYAAFSSDNCTILTASDDNTARVWDAHDGDPYTTQLTHNGTVHCIIASADGHSLLTVSDDKTARVWDLATGTLNTSTEVDRKPISSSPAMPISPDGKRVVRFKGWEALIVNAASGATMTPPLKHEERVTTATFSPDGRWVATGSCDATARIWDVATGAPRLSSVDQKPIILYHASFVSALAFSPDGSRIVTAGGDNTGRIWDPATGDLVTQPLYHNGSLNDVAFSPDGHRVATASNDRSARVWYARTGAPLTPPLEHRGAVEHVRFAPDGRSVITQRLGVRKTWELPREPRDAGVLLTVAQLLAGHRVSERGEYMPLGGAGQAELWSHLSRTEPELSPPSADDVRDWNKRCADECEEAGQWFGVVWHLDRLLEHEPGVWQERRRRGNALAELNRWKEALADHVAVADHTAKLDAQSQLALLYLANQDRAEYERICKEMLVKAGHDRDALPQAIWTCNVDGEAKLDRTYVVQVAERLAAEQKDAGSRALLGAALYRAGRFQEAVNELTPAVESLGDEEAREASLFLALAQHRLGKVEQARHWLRRAHEKRDLLTDHPIVWPRRLVLRWLDCEAQAAIGD